MIKATLAKMRNVSNFFREKFKNITEKIEKKKRLALLARVVKAQKQDPIFNVYSN